MSSDRSVDPDALAQAAMAVAKLFGMCSPVVMPGWDATTHVRSLALLDGARDRILDDLTGVVTVDDLTAWLTRWTPALGHVSMAHINSHPADAYRACDCGGTVEPEGTTHADEGDGSAMVDTRCAGTCGLQGSHHWTLTEREYVLTFGHPHGLDGHVDSALTWSEHLDAEREANGWTVDEQVAHAQAGMRAAGVALTGVMAKGARGDNASFAVLTTSYWVVGWDPERGFWKPLTRQPFSLDEMERDHDALMAVRARGCPAGAACTGMEFPGHAAHEVDPGRGK